MCLVIEIWKLCFAFSGLNLGFFVEDCDDFYFNIEGKKWIDTWTVIDRARPQKNYNCDKKIHPTQKALQVVKRLIEYHSKKDDVILDPYMGSATTAVACKLLGRNFVGCELDEGYVDLANKRLNETIQETFMESCKIVQ